MVTTISRSCTRISSSSPTKSPRSDFQPYLPERALARTTLDELIADNEEDTMQLRGMQQLRLTVTAKLLH
ncbi:unnamed protein product [Didymodactylos carnosus]|uniref:Uncharacterized protein n=1 Tax=Didymodactylos carnosus TaxID=1234261 RepID=A0A8S2FXZ6_9BILA|nr:unnamed protein product [Didymodactylos carnosus]CAF4388811.1 unnamed protein product [Didymodactylos carnosus]